MSKQELKSDTISYREETQQAIHRLAMESCNDSPSLSGCNCPKCGNTQTYDVQYTNNYYFGCVDCEKVVAIWIEDDIADSIGLPWFIL